MLLRPNPRRLATASPSPPMARSRCRRRTRGYLLPRRHSLIAESRTSHLSGVPRCLSLPRQCGVQPTRGEGLLTRVLPPTPTVRFESRPLRVYQSLPVSPRSDWQTRVGPGGVSTPPTVSLPAFSVPARWLTQSASQRSGAHGAACVRPFPAGPLSRPATGPTHRESRGSVGSSGSKAA